MDLSRGAQAAVDRVADLLSKNTKVITTTEESAQVAAVSAIGDTRVGNFIATVEKAGKEGVITVKEVRRLRMSRRSRNALYASTVDISPLTSPTSRARRLNLRSR